VTLALAIIAVCFSGLSLCVAAGAAYNAHRARQWQERRDSERRTTDVRVEILHAVSREPLDAEAHMRPLDYQLTLAVTNYGEVTEYITWVSIAKANEKSGAVLFGDMHHITDRREVAPRASATFAHRLNRAGLANFAEGFIGIVTLASGMQLRSGVEYLNEDLVEQVGTIP
jgi:hypothetical protein